MASPTKQRVLFLCTGNSARSQMAEGWLRALAGERFEVFSAGTNPRPRVHPLAIQVMRDAGVDLTAHRPKDVSQFFGRRFDWIITVCDNARDNCPSFAGEHRQLHWSLPDPTEVAEPQREAAFQQSGADLQARIRRFIGVTGGGEEPAPPPG